MKAVLKSCLRQHLSTETVPTESGPRIIHHVNALEAILDGNSGRLVGREMTSALRALESVQNKGHTSGIVAAYPQALPLATILAHALMELTPRVAHVVEHNRASTLQTYSGLFNLEPKASVVIVVNDLIHSPIVKAVADNLAGLGYTIIGVVSLIDHQLGAAETLRLNNIPVQSVFKLGDLVVMYPEQTAALGA